ncbi:glutathione S-transferase N-terminal domain-containing protein [Variovorax sp. E3]|uniref:glutathione S-transferase N-terminal domain-containing protein n=1 Tax=Variovorax sp. E3 TaxID=1914993 RepID=UPI0022B723EC|nr:glutathione S-transferase N-terminal domain-containing protein [Variovorax sp. E3]
MIKIHHLGHGQSERVVWLCEELGLPYELRHYTRDAVTRLSPPELKARHPLGAAPLIEDGDLLLAESAAIVEYIIVKHGGGRFSPGPGTRTTRPFSTGSTLPMATCNREWGASC